MLEVISRSFDDPDEITRFDKGKFVGDEPYVSLHFLGAGRYARPNGKASS